MTVTDAATANSTAPALLILIPLIAGAVLVFGTWARTKVSLTAKLGPPDWDFSASWASTIAGAGAVLGTILGASVLPASPHYLSAAAYTGLNLFFAVLVVLAPFFFAATRIRVGQDADGTLHYEGFVWSFLVASGLTIWAVLGELGTLGVLFWELHHAATLSSWSVGPIWLLLAGAILLTLYYSIRTLGWILETAQAHLQVTVVATAAAAAAAAVAAPAAAAAPVPLPEAPRWTLL